MELREFLQSMHQILLRIRSAGDVLVIPVDLDLPTDDETLFKSLSSSDPVGVTDMSYSCDSRMYAIQLVVSSEQAPRMTRSLAFMTKETMSCILFVDPFPSFSITSAGRATVDLSGSIATIREWAAPESLKSVKDWGKGWIEPSAWDDHTDQ